MNTNNLVFVIVLALVLAIIGGGVWYASTQAPEEEVPEEIKTLLDSGDLLEFNLEIPAPNLERELMFPDFFPEEARTALTERIAGFRTRLDGEPASLSAWLDLAIQYQTIEDFEGAEEVWLYLNEAAPAQSTSHHNLGNLYHLYLKRFEESEEQFREAIELNIGEGIHYLGLHELYRYSYKSDTSAPVDILLEGLTNKPNDLNMTGALAQYYKSIEDVENALEWFQKAKDIALEMGNQNYANQLDTEIRALQ